MTITILLILFAVLTLTLFVLRSVGVSRPVGDEAELSRRIQPVDLEAFRNLTDPEEEEFLRENLPTTAFRAIQRQRMRAAIEYVGGVFHNAGVLLQLGQAARRSPDARVAEAGRNLMDEAVRLRLYSVLATCKLCVRSVFPEAGLQPAGIVDRYQHVTEGAVQLGRLQYPSRGGPLSRTL